VLHLALKVHALVSVLWQDCKTNTKTLISKTEAKAKTSTFSKKMPRGSLEARHCLVASHHRLLAAVGTLKFSFKGFSLLLFESPATIGIYVISKSWATFCQCLVAWPLHNQTTVQAKCISWLSSNEQHPSTKGWRTAFLLPWHQTVKKGLEHWECDG